MIDRKEVASLLHTMGFIPEGFVNEIAFFDDLPYFLNRNVDIYATQAEVFGHPNMNERGIVCFFIKKNGVRVFKLINIEVVKDRELLLDELGDLQNEYKEKEKELA